MSWLGEQFSSFTEKITDFTKDMLPDSGDPGDEENLNISSKHLLELCKEKDAEISALMTEKLSLEKSMEELDSQHQEVISELLHLKNEAVKENTSIKDELLKQKEKLSAKSLFQKFEHNYSPKELNMDDTNSFSHSMVSKYLKNFNFVNIIGILWKSFNEVTLKSSLEWLKDQKLLLEAAASNVDDNSVNTMLSRINNYIMLLQLISENPKTFSPLIDELATVIHFLLSNFVEEHSSFSIPESFSEQSKISNESISTVFKTSDFSFQTITQDFDNMKDLFSINSKTEKSNYVEETSFSSQLVQTNIEDKQDDMSLVFKLKQYSLSLEQEKTELQARVSKLEEDISALQEHQCLLVQNPSTSVSVQTERMVDEFSSDISEVKESMNMGCDSDSLKLMELQTYVEILEQEKCDYEDQILKLQEIVDKHTSSAVTQTDDDLYDMRVHELEAGICILEQDKADLQEELLCLKSSLEKGVSSVEVQTERTGVEVSSSNLEVIEQISENEGCSLKLMELETYVEILEQEKSHYKNQISELLENVKKPISSAVTQTDDNFYDAHELEASICILEQDKADLQEELSSLKSNFEKGVSSVEVQTERTDVEVSSSNLEVIEQISKNEGCESASLKLMELETYVEILEQEKSHYKNQISELLENVKKPTSTAVTQTDDDFYDAHELEASICILEQDKADLQEELSSLKSNFEKDVSSVDVQTEEDSNLFDLLQSKISDLQYLIELSDNDYNTSMETMNEDLNKLKEEVNLKDLAITKKENIIQSLEHDLQESKVIIENLTGKLQSLGNINDLIEKVRIHENSVKENEAIIQSLECNLKECKATIKDLAIKAKQADDMHNELKQKESNLNEKINRIQALESELEENKATLSALSLKFNNLNNSLSEVLMIKPSVTLKNEDEIEKLKYNYNELEANIHTLIKKAQKLNDYDKLVKELESKESIINENLNQISDLEQNLVHYKMTAETLILKDQVLNQSTSSDTSTQTVENCYSCKLYESKIQDLQKSVYYKEAEIQDLKISIQNKEKIITQNERVIDGLKAELESFEKLVAVKDSTLDSHSKAELKKYEFLLERFSDETNKTGALLSIDADKNQCSCKKYEAELEKLKFDLSEKEKEVLAVRNNLNSNINDLKEILESKDLLVIDKEETIQSLKIELEEIKKKFKEHLNDSKVSRGKDYAKDIDTMEEQELKMIIGNCNRCKSLLNKESTDNDLKNEVQVLQDKLKAFEMDKSQLLCVLNEKTQECSSLKAEVHKLTNIVASEKQALYKLQQDNCLLKESRENADPELTKEAIQKLSVIIRDKDLEIESLKQKNVTLTTLIQDSTSVPDHLQSLIEEKENLTKQINVFKSDRDKIMAKYNTIDKDCRQYAAEVKKLQSALSEQKEKFDVLEQKHFSVAQQYEEKQKSLINTQNEMIALKQRVTDLEQQQVDIKEKYSELLNKFNSDTIVQLTKDELEEKYSLIAQLTAITKEKDNLIEEKDCLIHELSQQIKLLKAENDQQQQNISALQIKVEEFTTKLNEYETLVEQHQNEKENLEMRFQDKNSELGLLKDMNERLNMNLREKEFTIQSMTEKISSLSHYISSDHMSSDTVDINQILADSELLFSKAQSLYKERDETILALNQSKQENQSLRNEIQRMKSNEIHLQKELERLRTHLLEIEENYTAEALKAEEREKELRDELMEVKRRAEISNSAVVDTSQRASIQIASLQEQLSMIASQRDQALTQVSTLEDKVHQHSASISKLQLVLEQMQRSNERKVKDVEKKFNAELEKKKQLCNELEERLRAKEMQLEESTQALEAASRLSEQLDAKEEMIIHLKNELIKTESKFKSTAQEIDNIKSNTEGKVDRMVMKSLVLGYFSTPPGQKSEVVRLLARVLDFNQEEMEKAGIVVGRSAQRNEQRGFFSSVFSRLPVLGSESNPAPPEKSFTTLFVQFLENESQPIVPMPFPAEKMVHEHPSKQPIKRSPTPEKKNLSRSNPLLLDIDSAFPTFSPVPAIEYSQSPAPSILREVLE